MRDLQTTLASYEPAPENPPPTPLQFQDRLRTAVDDTVGMAQRAGVELPKEKFYLGFEQYSGTPPEAAATAGLSAELNAINDLVGILMRNKRIESLASIKRAPLPGEAGAATPAPLPGRPGAVPAAAAAAPLVVKHPIEIGFTALPSSFREILNTITTSKRLYVVRAVQVKNQTPAGPPRAAPDAAASPAPGAPVLDPTQPQRATAA